MSKMIQYLMENPNILKLLKERKLSLIGVSAVEQQAIIESFNEPIYIKNNGWR